jgi:hypothetical protein
MAFQLKKCCFVALVQNNHACIPFKRPLKEPCILIPPILDHLLMRRPEERASCALVIGKDI